VVIATRLLWIELTLSIADWALQLQHWPSFASATGVTAAAAPAYVIIPSVALRFAIRAWLTIKIHEGRNWARMTLLVIALLGLVLNVVVAARVFAKSPMAEFVSLGLTLLVLTALALLFTRPANEWFEREQGSMAMGG